MKKKLTAVSIRANGRSIFAFIPLDTVEVERMNVQDIKTRISSGEMDKLVRDGLSSVECGDTICYA